jgi:hypothetical protein
LQPILRPELQKARIGVQFQWLCFQFATIKDLPVGMLPIDCALLAKPGSSLNSSIFTIQAKQVLKQEDALQLELKMFYFLILNLGFLFIG